MLPITPAAAALVAELAKERGVDPRLRIRVVGGGCSGLTWDFEIGAAVRPGDHRRAAEGVTVLVDPLSASYLRGSRVELGPVAANRLRLPTCGASSKVALVLAGLMTKNVCPCGESFTPV